VALSVVLLINAGLLVRSLQELLHVDLGYVAEGVHVANFQPRPEAAGRPDIETYYPALLERVREVPGVEAASTAQTSLALGAVVQPVSRMVSPAPDGVRNIRSSRRPASSSSGARTLTLNGCGKRSNRPGLTLSRASIH
jgi:hypothetical protein